MLPSQTVSALYGVCFLSHSTSYTKCPLNGRKMQIPKHKNSVTPSECRLKYFGMCLVVLFCELSFDQCSWF
jgi:hypothetical protein